MKKIGLVLADDHPILLVGLKQLLQSDFEIVGTASDGVVLIDLVSKMNPDVMIVDIAMPELNGIDAARRIHKTHPGVKIVILSMHSEPSFLKKAFEAGARAYVLKSEAGRELRAAVFAVLAGDFYVSPMIGGDGMTTSLPEAVDREGELTKRQLEILQLVADGLVSKQIAYALNISVKTVEFHRARMMQRLGANSLAKLMRVAVEQGIILRTTEVHSGLHGDGA